MVASPGAGAAGRAALEGEVDQLLKAVLLGMPPWLSFSCLPAPPGGKSTHHHRKQEKRLHTCSPSKARLDRVGSVALTQGSSLIKAAEGSEH